MTIASETVSVSYNGNGVTTAFSVTFPFFEIVVEAITSGVVTTQSVGTHYTVTGGNGSTGTVTMLTAPASGTVLRIRRVTSRLQDTDYVENDPFPAETHEMTIDRAHMILIEFAAHMDKLRALGPDDGAPSELTIASGVITPTGSYHAVDTQADAATDDLDTITATGAKDGDFLILRAAHADRTVVVKNGTGNIILSDDYEMSTLSRLCVLMYVEAIESWVELNGIPGPQGEQGEPGLNGAGSGDVVGPASSTDNALAAFDGTTGKLLENTTVTWNGSNFIVSRAVAGGAATVQIRRATDPGGNHEVGQLIFEGLDSGATNTQIARISGTWTDRTDTSEDAAILFSTIIAGTLAERFRLGHGLYRASITGGDKGSGTINVDAVYEADSRVLTQAGGTLATGWSADVYDRGTVTTTAQTPTFAEGNLQKMTRNGAFTLNPPSSGNGHITILVTNGASASTLTTSSFTKVNTDALTSTSGDDFLFHITKIDTFSRLYVEALQ